jgi:hypothetical protein
MFVNFQDINFDNWIAQTTTFSDVPCIQYIQQIPVQNTIWIKWKKSLFSQIFQIPIRSQNKYCV